MPEHVSSLLSRLQVNPPELTRGELWTMVILGGVIAAGLFVLFKPHL